MFRVLFDLVDSHKSHSDVTNFWVGFGRFLPGSVLVRFLHGSGYYQCLKSPQKNLED